MADDRRVELIMQAFADFEARSVDGLARFLHPEIESRVAPAMGNPGTWNGPAGFVAMTQSWEEPFGGSITYEVKDVELIDDRNVLVAVHQAATGAISGVPVELDVVFLVEFEGEQAIRFHVYADRDSALAAVCLDPAPMALKTDAAGKTWDAATFTVEASRIAQYADAIGADSPLHRDAEAARAAGFRDVVAPPMFCVVYSSPAMGPAILDPEVGINFAAMVHGGQVFEWGEPVCAGDEITTSVECTSISERDGKGFYVFESVSHNQHGSETVRGTWTNIVRGVS